MKVAIKRKKTGTIHCHQWCLVQQTIHIVINIGTNAGQKKVFRVNCSTYAAAKMRPQ